MPPKILAKNADRTGGVLPVNAAARANATKPPAVRLKLEVRRLPPSLTLTEFEETLGAEWKLGNGKVDWREYRQGKTRAAGSGKVPEQSRCYLHLVSESSVKEFEKRFLEVIFQDKAGTHKSPELKNLQPTLGFAPNQRTPLQQSKQRTDNRQGTIDQDPEFIAFLEGETQPITKPAALDSTSVDKDGERRDIKTTPLIEDLRERKANKAKAAQAKAEKDKKAQAGKGSGKDGPGVSDKDATKGSHQQKVEQAAKEAAKALNKQAAAKQQQAQGQAQKAAPSPAKAKKGAAASAKQPTATVPASSASTTAASSGPAPQRAARKRGNAEGIKKMLQKDLGIRPKPAASASANAAGTSVSTTLPATPTSPVATTASAPADKSVPPSPKVSTATPAEPKSPPLKAYLKHANPSQGMTEILIQQALSQYGEVTNVTIDPRKGTAIAVFKQAEALKNALEAKKVPVASGAVEVLEFRDRSGAGASSRGGARGGRSNRGGGGRGGSQGSAAVTTPAASTATTVPPTA